MKNTFQEFAAKEKEQAEAVAANASPNKSAGSGAEDSSSSTIVAVVEDRASTESFPHKLYRMLFEAEKEGQDSIVSFLPSGRGFIIHKPKEFAAMIMPRYFTTRRVASFQRQVREVKFFCCQRLACTCPLWTSSCLYLTS